jgi:glycosyltransferase involved in cell wall biosynthesis
MNLNKKLKILLVTQYFPPEVAAGANRAYEHAKRWVKLGAEVTVVTCFPNYPTGKIPDKYKGMKYFEEMIDGIKVLRTFTYATPNKGFFRRILAYFSFMFSSVIQSRNRIGEQDVIIASSPPYTVGISGMILGKLKKTPFVFEVRDLWPESIIQLGQVKNKFAIKILEYIELLMYKNASLIIGISDPFVKFISSKGISKEKIKIIKNGVNLNLFQPQKIDIELNNSLKFTDKFVISYFGTFGLAQGLESILRAAEILIDNTAIQFLFIGDGADREKLLYLKDTLNLQNITILNPIPKEELVKYYSISDILLVPLKKLKLFDSALPSKMFEIMAMGKPILHTVDGEARKLLDQGNAGIYVEAENATELSKVILEILQKKDWLKEASLNSRKLVKEKFNRDELAKNYLELLINNFGNKNEY